MEVIGFNFTKIFSERFPQFHQETSINTNVEFTECTRETLDFLKDKEGIRMVFKFTILYNSRESKDAKKDVKGGEVLFEGHLLIASEKDLAKDLWKAGKKKKIPIGIKAPLFNLPGFPEVFGKIFFGC